MYIGTDHELLLGIFGNPGLENIENLRLIQLKEKETPGLQFSILKSFLVILILGNSLMLPINLTIN